MHNGLRHYSGSPDLNGFIEELSNRPNGFKYLADHYRPKRIDTPEKSFFAYGNTPREALNKILIDIKNG